MNYIYVLSFLLAAVAVNSYRTDYDNLEIKDIITDVNVLRAYNHCFLDIGECTDVGKFFKRVIPETVINACHECTPAQKRLADKYYEALEAKLPEEYEAIKKKFDPEGIYFDIFRSAVTKY